MTDLWPEPAARDWGFPRAAAGVLVLVRYAVTRGLGADTVLAGTGLSLADLEADREVTAVQELRVVRTLHARLGDVGRDVGRRYRAETFGAFGYAMLASRSVLEAMRTALRFLDLSFAFALPTADLDGDEVVVRLDAAGLPADVRGFLLDRDAAAVHRVLESLVPGGVGAVLRVDGDLATVRFGVAELDRPLPRRSAETLALAEETCRAVVDGRRARTGLAADVRVLVLQRLSDGAPMPDVAAALAMTERTLRRRLAAEDVGYRELVDEVRAALAAALLGGRSTMPVALVAERLGYASSAALAHARQRWTASDRARRPV